MLWGTLVYKKEYESEHKAANCPTIQTPKPQNPINLSQKL